MPRSFRSPLSSLLIAVATAMLSPPAAAFGEVVSVATLSDVSCYAAPSLLSDKSLMVTVQLRESSLTGVAKLHPDGSRDASFGQNGIALIPASLGYIATHMPLPDGSVLGIGERIVRLDARGMVDTSYGNAGASDAMFAAAPGQGITPVLQSDGKLVVAARVPEVSAWGAASYDLKLARFDASGARDGTFADSGLQVIPLTYQDFVYAWTVQPNGAVDVGSYRFAADGSVVPTLKRYSPYLSVLSEFQPGTRLIPSQGVANWVSSTVKVDAFGGVLIASSLSGSGRLDAPVMLSRFGPDGLPDPAFGIDGRVIAATVDPDPSANSSAGTPLFLSAAPGGGWTMLAYQSTEFGVGFSRTSVTSTRALRFNSAGGLDASFGQLAQIQAQVARSSFTQMDDGSLLGIIITEPATGCQVLKAATDRPRVEGTIVEYYHPRLDHYFMTLEGLEVGILDNNVPSMGWLRTGQTYGSWEAVDLPGTARVCRFYGDLSAGPNSHFYIPQGPGCEDLRILEANAPLGSLAWRLEGLAFGTVEAHGGRCAENLTPVYRFYNGGFEKGIDSNHRYVVDPAVHAQMVSKGWIAEGIAFCMPPLAPRKNTVF